MIIIADSGSTKTDWCAIENKSVLCRIQTKGINPFFQQEEEICEELSSSLLPLLPEKEVNAIYFYGAGCTPEKAPVIVRAISQVITVQGEIQVNSDMLAAARSLCGRQPGIACILGTGSNSCYYDGEKIEKNISPLGFILGDEGSGAVLGKLLVGDLLKNQLPQDLKEAFLQQFGLTPPEIIDRVYRQPFPNRFLAGLAPFLAQHMDNPALYNLVLDSFKSFLQRNVMQYDSTRHTVHFIGSIAFYFQEVLRKAAQETGIQLGIIEKSPMKGLIEYHLS